MKMTTTLIEPLLPMVQGMEDTGTQVEIFFVFPHDNKFSTFQFFKYFRQPFKFEFYAGGKTLHTQFLDYEFGCQFFSLWKKGKKTVPQRKSAGAYFGGNTNEPILDDDSGLCYECSENEATTVNNLCQSCLLKLTGNE